MFKYGDTITQDQVNEYVAECRKKLNGIKPIRISFEKGKKVMFDPKCKLARKKFKEDYPDNPITRKKEDVSYYITNENVQYTSGVDVGYMFHDISAGRAWWQTVASITLDSKSKYHQRGMQQLEQINNQIWFLENHVMMVDEASVDIKQHFGREMDKEELKRVKDLLRSSDHEMVKLGTAILTSFDFTTNEDNYALCLLCCRFPRHLPQTRLFRSIKRKIKDKYPNIRI